MKLTERKDKPAKFITLLVVLILAFTFSASAQESVYLRNIPQYKYINSSLIPSEVYPEVCIFPGYWNSLFSSYSDTEPTFLCFPGPEGALATSFSESDASYLDEENEIQYYYYVSGSASFEEFLAEAASSEYILKDGSDKTAAYIDPDRQRAYGMIATEEFGSVSKLQILIGLDSLSSKMPLDTIIDALSEAILTEMDRIQSQMHYESLPPFWSYGKYAGAKLLDNDFQKLVKIDFPVITRTVETENGSVEAEGTWFVTNLNRARMSANADFGEGNIMEMRLDFESYSYAAGKIEEGSEDAFSQVLDSGNEWLIYLNKGYDGGIISWYADLATDYLDKYSEDPYYISLNVSGFTWDSTEAVLEDLALFDKNITLMDAADDPYVPGEAVSVTPNTAGDETVETSQEAPADLWICPECGQENEGNFCPNDGTPRPDPSV